MDLDAWLPAPQVRTRHSRRARVAPDALWAAARALRLDETGPLARIVRWRIPGTPARATFAELFAAAPFVVLEEARHASVSGLAGRIWTLARDYPRLDRDAFTAWDEPGTVRVLFAHWVEPDGGGSVLHSEARVRAVDRAAALRLRALWLAIGPLERLIGTEALARAARRAEAHG